MQNPEEPKSNHAKSIIQPKSNQLDLPHQKIHSKTNWNPLPSPPRMTLPWPTSISTKPITNLSNPETQQHRTQTLAISNDQQNPATPYLSHTHNPLQPYPPLPLSTSHSKKKNPTTKPADPPTWKRNHWHKEREWELKVIHKERGRRNVRERVEKSGRREKE